MATSLRHLHCHPDFLPADMEMRQVFEVMAYDELRADALDDMMEDD